MTDQKRYAIVLSVWIPAFFFISCNLQQNQSRLPPTEQILNADMAFSDMMRQVGMKKAFLQYIDDEGVLLRPDHKPITGADAVDFLSLLSDTSYTLALRPSGAQISKSEDMGFAYGIYTLTFPDTVFKGTYINVWKKESTGEWKLVLNSNNPGIR